MTPETIKLIELEMATARAALTESNDGKARVCARRAVIIALQESINNSDGNQWNSRLALEHIARGNEFPDDVIFAAKRLQGGLRAQLEGKMYSQNPIEDAEIIIRYFVDLL